MREDYFFEIPIYTQDPDRYEATRQRRFNILYPQYTKPGQNTIRDFEYAFQKYLWRPWRYNQVIGWIALFVFGKDIRGDYYLVDSKRRNYLLIKKRFEYMGKAFECGFYNPCKSQEIFHKVSQKISSCQTDFKENIHIDMNAFNYIGQFINWDELLGY